MEDLPYRLLLHGLKNTFRVAIQCHEYMVDILSSGDI